MLNFECILVLSLYCNKEEESRVTIARACMQWMIVDYWPLVLLIILVKNLHVLIEIKLRKQMFQSL